MKKEDKAFNLKKYKDQSHEVIKHHKLCRGTLSIFLLLDCKAHKVGGVAIRWKTGEG